MLPELDVLLARLGPAVLPFGRLLIGRRIKPGEDIPFPNHIIRLDAGNVPENCIRCTPFDVIDLPADCKYLWIIDGDGLRVIKETTPNTLAERGYVCHTNITGGAEALQGGELWFCTDDLIYLNYKSGRYGAETEDQKQAVLDYFQQLGFTVIRLPDRLP